MFKKSRAKSDYEFEPWSEKFADPLAKLNVWFYELMRNIRKIIDGEEDEEEEIPEDQWLKYIWIDIKI